jgi:hypothetical protein
MSTAPFFLVLVPIGLLAIAWSLCFVGCVLPTSGLPGTPYSDTIVKDPNLIAYWPLSDLIGTSAAPGTLNMEGQTAGASDISGNGHNGTYTIPFAYPSAGSANAVQFTKPIAAPFLKRATSIVPGDAGSIKNPLAASLDFEGGFVTIPWSTQNSPKLTDFTLEAWINPDPNQSGFWRVLFGAVAPGDMTGFVVFIDDMNNWQFGVADGTAVQFVQTGQSALNGGYVAVTFQSTSSTAGILSLWLNPDSDTSAPPTPVWPPNPNQTTNYVAADPSQLMAIFIGAGANEETLRTANGGAGAPQFPFLGQIQSVALYKTALDPTELQSHFQAGGTTG